ncbi:MAG: threonylcarbamoyl-AMP synthase, partial [bacterium]|nr:threonylcarbamoyl-AMP synthase [bacterium]
MDTQRLPTDSDAARTAAIRQCAQLLVEGGVVALPTETVYGLAVNPDHEQAVERLRKLKKRSAEKPFSLAFADQDAAFARARRLTPAALRLAERYWPGPLTLVVEEDGGGTIGLRVPGNEVTRAVLAAAGVPAALPSANPADLEPARHADQVAGYFAGQIDAIVDGGTAPLGRSSTVVLATDSQLKVLREGVLTTDEIDRTAVTNLLFVCTGNTCRSPMAELLLKAVLARRLGVAPEHLPAAGFRIGSAGL